ncbi:MAG: tetratricopeptide (TPR) repeat protein [Flavobacteriales bacterium]|jgi:tetratricopeptide (TPR) repeat protein|tara:strand:+ start:1352 stop:1816 length:465 start_codon:yes stop_codon:yes gene_type:complete
MKFFILYLLLFAFGFINAQQSKIDSAQSKIQKYYNNDLSDSLRNDYNAKIAHMDKYIAQDSVNPKAFLQRGVYYGMLGLSVEAISDYDMAIKLNDNQPIAYFNRALAKARFRYSYDACYDLKKAYILGLDQANEIFNSYCRLYKTKIDQEISSN